MRKIAIISGFPGPNDAMDGMMQRVIEIDSILSLSGDLQYVDVSIKQYIFKNRSVEVNGLKGKFLQHRFNFFIHQYYVYKVLTSVDLIYVHSVMKYLLIFPALIFIKCPIILDIHGVVPEEFAWSGKKLRSYLYATIERLAIKRSRKLIAVSHAMIDYYIKKYKYLERENFVLLPVFDRNNITSKNKKNNEKLTIVYAGGLQKWQNFQLMVDIVRKLGKTYFFRFYIPHRYVTELETVFKNSDVTVDSLSKTELINAYDECDLGFLLRDDIVVNRVSSPTKLNEYIKSNIVPLVISMSIGDVQYYGYRCILLDDILKGNIPTAKELKDIARENLENYQGKYISDVNLGRDELLEYITSHFEG